MRVVVRSVEGNLTISSHFGLLGAYAKDNDCGCSTTFAAVYNYVYRFVPSRTTAEEAPNNSRQFTASLCRAEVTSSLDNPTILS